MKRKLYPSLSKERKNLIRRHIILTYSPTMYRFSPEKSTPAVLSKMQRRGKTSKHREYDLSSKHITTMWGSSLLVPLPIRKLSRNTSNVEFGSAQAWFINVTITVFLSFIDASFKISSKFFLSSASIYQPNKKNIE